LLRKNFAFKRIEVPGRENLSRNRKEILKEREKRPFERFEKKLASEGRKGKNMRMRHSCFTHWGPFTRVRENPGQEG